MRSPGYNLLNLREADKLNVKRLRVHFLGVPHSRIAAFKLQHCSVQDEPARYRQLAAASSLPVQHCSVQDAAAGIALCLPLARYHQLAGSQLLALATTE